MSAKLTPKQAIFIAEVLVDNNATRAAIAAGVPEKSAAVTASRWLKNPRIAAVIAERQAQRAAKLDITADRVLEELARLAYYDPGKLYDQAGKRIPVHLLDENTRRAVSMVEDEHRGGKHIQRVKMSDKGQSLERLGKHLRLFGGESFGAIVETGAGGLPADSTIKIVLVRPE